MAVISWQETYLIWFSGLPKGDGFPIWSSLLPIVVLHNSLGQTRQIPPITVDDVLSSRIVKFGAVCLLALKRMVYSWYLG